jgi:hypothetical protein
LFLLVIVLPIHHLKGINMKKIIFAGLALLFVFTGFSQSPDENRQTRNVSGFHGVAVSGGIDLFLSAGPESVAITASNSSIRDHIKTEVENGILRIYMDHNGSWHLGNPKMKAYVSIPALKNLEASGGSDVYLQNQMTSSDLEISLSGGSDLKGKLNANHLVIKQSGGSDVDISGTVQKLDVDASGGSDLNGYGLVTEFASLHASGGCDSHLTVNKELRIVASGDSDVSYRGTASVKEIKTSGSSAVTHKD